MKGIRRAVAMPDEKIEKETVTRLFKLITDKYKKHWILALICILVSTGITVLGSFFIEMLIDDYIEPLLIENVPNYYSLFKFLIFISLVFIVGIVFNYIYQRVMVVISQGIIKELRDNMFTHMQKLSIKYFDTHKHGDIMSFYTNDVDTLGQVVSGSIPTLITSILSIIFILISMIIQNIWLTIISIIGVILMVMCTKTAAEKSAKYFEEQQTSKAKLNGFVEEMVTGQKVVKVFTHEEKAKEEFNKINEELCKNAFNAEGHANIIGPISNNVGHIIYVVIAIVGGAMVVKGYEG